MAVPSTTSITPNPHKFVINDAALTATAPPILWPTRMTGLFFVVAFTIAATSLEIKKKKNNMIFDFIFVIIKKLYLLC